jgi:hypothetical protein
MIINAIKTDSAGYKLISASFLVNRPKFKPRPEHLTFYDYKDGILRKFSYCSVWVAFTGTYRDALKFILSARP